MSERTVTTQTELDDALTAEVDTVIIDSPTGVWLYVGRDGQAWGASSVVAWGASSVVAWGASSVVARGASSVVAWGASSVEARDSSSVEARDSSSVEAWDSSSVEAWDSSSVVAWGASSVVARGASSVVARGASSVVAWDSSSVVARDSSSVVAGTHVAIHLHSQRVNLTGGVVIDMTTVDQRDPATWAGMHGSKTAPDGTTILYKALDADWQAGHNYTLTTYRPGDTVTASDWSDDNDCGGGLHLSPSPSCARQYRQDAARYVAVRVVLADMRPIPGGAPKVKVRTCEVLHEVDLWGRAGYNGTGGDVMNGVVYVWPAWWPDHGRSHDFLDCTRCGLEADWVEDHDGCDCLDHDWERVDVGTAAVPKRVWVCSGCLLVAGPSYSGGVS